MTAVLKDYEETISIGGKVITNLWFADDIDSETGDEEELVNLVKKLAKISHAYGREISAEKTKSMTNSNNKFKKDTKKEGKTLKNVNNFKYLGRTISEEGLKSVVLDPLCSPPEMY